MKTRFNPFAVAVQTTARVPAPQPKPTRPVTPAPAGKPVRAKRRTTRSASAEEALARAQAERSLTNYPIIIQAFTARGIPVDQIQPRENVLTFRAWLAKGRAVKKGEKGVRIGTVIPIGEKESVDPQTGEVTATVRTRPWHATVFHITQTEPVSSRQRAPRQTTPTPAPAPSPSRDCGTVASPARTSWMKYATVNF